MTTQRNKLTPFICPKNNYFTCIIFFIESDWRKFFHDEKFPDLRYITVLRKLSARIFLHTRKFDFVEFITACMRFDFLDAVELLLCSSFSFLDKLLRMFLLRYLQPNSNKRPKWACFAYCTHAESSYLTAKLASNDLPLVERSVSLCEANSR